MQGTLNEIDIRSILQLIELGQRTGQLFVEAYPLPLGSLGNDRYAPRLRTLHVDRDSKLQTPGWFVFFLNGQIAYAAESEASLLRLRDYLRRYRIEPVIDHLQVPAIASTNALEYGYIWALLESHTLSPAQGRAIIRSMVHETLFDLFSLRQGSFIFDIGGPAIAPQLTTLEINPLTTKIVKQVQEWKQLTPLIQSPNQCPLIADAAHLQQALPERVFRTLERELDGKTSLRQLSRHINRDIPTVARAIYPYVQQGWVQMPPTPTHEPPHRHPTAAASSAPPRIFCIDDDLTIGKMIQQIVEGNGYHFTSIQDPIGALSYLFQIKPDLILCDITMPELDGYQICAMLRNTHIFRQTPIVMLTGKDGFIDRVRARMVGSTDYLTKPFGANELLMLLENLVGPGCSETTAPQS